MSFLTATGHQIYFEQLGRGPTVLLLHDATGSHRAWRRQIPVLVDAGYRVIAYDRHGFGQSDPLPFWSLTYLQDSVAELLDLLDKLTVGRTALLGHSDGATISLMAAAQQPERIAAVVAAAPHIWFDERRLHTGFETFSATTGASDRFWRAMARAHGAMAQQVVQRWQARWLDPAFRSWDARHHLPHVQCPVLVIHGADDIFFPVEHSQTIADQISDSQLLLLPGLGHAPHRQAPELFNRHALEFLQTKYPNNP